MARRRRRSARTGPLRAGMLQTGPVVLDIRSNAWRKSDLPISYRTRVPRFSRPAWCATPTVVVTPADLGAGLRLLFLACWIQQQCHQGPCLPREAAGDRRVTSDRCRNQRLAEKRLNNRSEPASVRRLRGPDSSSLNIQTEPETGLGATRTRPMSSSPPHHRQHDPAVLGVIALVVTIDNVQITGGTATGSWKLHRHNFADSVLRSETGARRTAGQRQRRSG